MVYDNLSRGWADFVKWGPLIEGDILDLDRLTQAMRQAKPDAVAHFAALAYVGESVVQPADYYRVNTVGALNVLSAMRTAGVNQIVFSSTCATYGLPLKTPIDEDQTQRPINPYGWSKLFVERMLIDHDAAYGIRHVALRYFNAAGADPFGELGERHDPETHIIPLAIQGVRRDGDIFQVYGTDYDTLDGTAVRDYVHVSDIAKAHLLSIQHLVRGGVSMACNLGTGAGTSVREVIRAVELVSGKSLLVATSDRRAGDPPLLIADASRAAKELNWIPTRSRIEDIIVDAWRWHQTDDKRAQVCAL